ncbi:hypothetical protein, partial [Raoultella terrigena]|uniref:hypothetical protein n=1 Tax=Raoultella terrigena TaxID=577 RepID=UPI003BF51F97
SMGFFCCLRFMKSDRMPTGSGAVRRYLWLFRREKAGGFGVTARRTPAINGQASNKQRNRMRKHGVFLLSAV